MSTAHRVLTCACRDTAAYLGDVWVLYGGDVCLICPPPGMWSVSPLCLHLPTVSHSARDGF